MYFSVGTLALAEMLRITVTNTTPNISALPIGQLTTYTLQPRYFLALGLAAVCVAATYGSPTHASGWAWSRYARTKRPAESTVDALRHKMAALVISSLFAGLAGGLFAFHDVSYYLYSPFSPVWTFDSLLIVFIGGVGTVLGPVIGAFFFVILREVLAQALTDVHLIVFGVLFILVVLLLPGGLLEAVAPPRPPIRPRAPGLSPGEATNGSTCIRRPATDARGPVAIPARPAPSPQPRASLFPLPRTG